MVLTITMDHTVTIWGLYDSNRSIILGCVLGKKIMFWLDLGRSRWVKAEHYYWRPFKAISKFPEGYEVSYCDGIDGAYKGSINSKTSYSILP